MKIAIIVFLILLVIMGGAGIVVYTIMKKQDLKISDPTENPGIKTVQEFTPLKDITQNMMILDGNRFRAVIQCSSTNYLLKTSGEKEQIELSFQRFLNTITFPITFFLQTKTIDNTERLRPLKEKCSRTIRELPGIEEYAKTYQKEMANLNERLGNNHQKNRYIIVSYDEAGDLSELTPEEKSAYAAKELKQRCNILISNLEAVGVTSHQLDNEELFELLYSSYYRDDYSYASEISSGDAFALIVHGEEDKFQKLPKAALLDLILAETVNHIQIEGLDDIPSGKEVLSIIEQARRDYAGYFEEVK